MLSFSNFQFQVPGRGSVIVNGEIKNCERVLLSAPSGTGKSTFLRAILGFHAVEAGDLQLNGTSLISKTPAQRKVGAVFQGGALWDHMSVQENILWARQLNGIKDDGPVYDCLEEMGLLKVKEKPAGFLSGGEKSRLALLRTLLCEFDFYFFDEPFNGMDLHIKKKAVDLVLRFMSDRSSPLILVTHEAIEAERIATRHVFWDALKSCIQF